jgi:hypothetical protein
MLFIRLFGGLLLVLALMLLGADVVTMLEQGAGLITRSVDQILALIFGGSLAGWVEATLPTSPAGYINFVLGLPAWMLLGGIALIFIFIDMLATRSD